MSQSVQEVLNAISEASAALNREPEYKASIASLQDSLDKSMKHAQELELHIIEYKAVIDDLQKKVRSLEVERDDMGFRELEAHDKLHALRSLVQQFTTSAESHMPKPVPIVEAVPSFQEIKEVASAASGSSSNPPQIDNPRLPVEPVNEMGQSESPLPQSANSAESQSPSVHSTVENTATVQPMTSPKPYEGKTYTQVFGKLDNQCTYNAWIDGGGTYDGFYH